MVLGDAGLTRIEWGARKVAPDTIGHDDESRRGLTPAGAALDHDYASSSVLLAQGSHLDGDGFQPGEGARPDMLDLGDDAGSDHIHPATAVGGRLAMSAVALSILFSPSNVVTVRVTIYVPLSS